MLIPSGKLLQRGQAFLIVVLVMVVALTIGLSIASRSLTNVRLTTEEVSSQRAFSAAEAGVEQLLQKYGLKSSATGSLSDLTLDQTTQTKISDASINPVIPQSINGTYQIVLNNSAPIAQDDGYDIWLTPYDADPANLYQSPWNGSMSIYWGESSANTCSATPANNSMAALEIVVIYNNRTSPLVTKYAYDPCSSGRRASNHFSAPTVGPYPIGTKTFLYRATINISDGLIARVIPVYASAVVGISSITPLPAQGQLVVSNGVSGTSSEVKRQISYFQAWTALPSEYYHALFVR
jgi:hypothetical protein